MSVKTPNATGAPTLEQLLLDATRSTADYRYPGMSWKTLILVISGFLAFVAIFGSVMIWESKSIADEHVAASCYSSGGTWDDASTSCIRGSHT